ncbi:MAG TPA: DEAD/DEAH box helicase, partial [Actinomycetota bacterium]|nr:DEAD/DEAH box helicase [Actinomycetota bacterium]
MRMTDDLTEAFAAGYDFTFDDFQTNACRALERSESVLVAAPTGSGKTVVGEFAVWLALRSRGKVFYTTPLKALSNQKFADLCAIHGTNRVGLLTGDNSINAGAPVVVMTTEVLRNMIYERSDLLVGLMFVVLDEVHYLQDRYRGAVWEEVIIHLPVDVQIVSLSATVSNAEEFADWIQTLRGPTAVVIEERRPIALEQHFLVEGKIVPLFVGQSSEGKINPQIRRIHARKVGSDRGRGSRVQRSDVVGLMEGMEMLPAIYFIFSRKGCDSAVEQCIREGVRLIDRQEAARVRRSVDERFKEFDDSDLEVLGYERWLTALTKGVAAHHAGLIPAFKETVEELFLSGSIKVVFATETLSLGINMPARTVFIESLFHFTGDQHEMLTPGSFTQLTGRAGRRGIDVVGHSVVPAQREVTVQQIAGLATTRTFPLRSSFEASYNMTANLVRNYSMAEAEHLLNSSFGQYQADSSVVVLEKLIERNRAYMMSYREKMACDLGEFSEYLTLVEGLETVEREARELIGSQRATAVRNFVATLRPGDAFFSRGGKARGPVLVVAADRSRRGDPRILVLTPDRRLTRLTTNDLLGPASVTRLPDSTSIKDLSGSRSIPSPIRRALASQLSSLDLLDQQGKAQPSLPPPETIELSRAVEDHPCHACPDRSRHMQWAQRLKRLEREESGL